MTQTSNSEAPSRPDEVRAEHVQIEQGGASSIYATTVTVNQGGAAMVRATDVNVSQGGIGLARARQVTLRESSSAVALVAEEASVGAGSNVMLLLARNVSGDIRPMLDWRAAAAFGAALGVVLAFFRRR